jgi:hypothetical protein
MDSRFQEFLLMNRAISFQVTRSENGTHHHPSIIIIIIIIIIIVGINSIDRVSR